MKWVALDTIFWFAAGVLTLSGVVRFVVYPMWREVKEALVWWRKFQRDWDGEEEEPGRTRVPGVMERLNEMDGQLQRNGGNSLKDKVFDTYRVVEDLSDRLTVVEQRQCRIEEHIFGS